MKITKEQVEALAGQLASVAAIFDPAHAPAILALVKVANELGDMLESIQANDPDMFDKVAIDFHNSLESLVAAEPGN